MSHSSKTALVGDLAVGDMVYVDELKPGPSEVVGIERLDPPSRIVLRLRQGGIYARLWLWAYNRIEVIEEAL